MLKRLIQFAALFVIALPFVSFLPLYIRRAMTRSQTSGGDIIDYEWKIITLYDFLSNYIYYRSEEDFSFWYAVNLGLACFYAFIFALIVILLLVYRKHRKDKIKK